MLKKDISFCSDFISANKGNKKPLFRWTVGMSRHENTIFLESVRTMRLLYGDEVDGVAVFNTSFSKKSFSMIKKYLQRFNVDCIWAEEESLPFKPAMSGWKFYPPRLRLQSHEIFIDTDLVLLSRGRYIDKFLKSEVCMGNCAFGTSYGVYEQSVKWMMGRNYQGINAGLFGFPPEYNVEPIIKKHFQGWNNWFDEQGLTVMLVVGVKHMLIPPPYVYNYYNDENSYSKSFRWKYPVDIYRHEIWTDEMEGFHFCTAGSDGFNPAWLHYCSFPFGEVNKDHDGFKIVGGNWSSGSSRKVVSLI